MELVVRIRRKLTEIGRKAKVIYVPDPLCWTEAPSDRKILGRQRNRWMRGTIETLSRHRKICLNPKYGLLGVLSYPYWFMFELLAPWIELSGLLFFVYLTLAGFVNWGYTLTLLLFVYLFSIFISVLTLLFEEISFYRYTRQRDFYKMLATACLEPVLFHPSVMYWAIRGTFDKWRGRKSWGEMSRTGFLKKAEAK